MQPRPQFLAILNLTPDSFSDGGTHHTVEKALHAAETALQFGASYIDIGAESTRPGATSLTPDEEWQRLKDLLPLLHSKSIPVSIDSRTPSVIAQALAHGVKLVNDVTGGHYKEIRTLIARHPNITYCIMHSLTVPADKTIHLPDACDPIEEIITWAKTQIATCLAEGISRQQLIIDPGIGFGKTATQSWEILTRVKELVHFAEEEKVRLLIGHSRKSLYKTRSLHQNQSPTHYDIETLCTSLILATQGVHFLRVHNMELHARGWAVLP